MSADEPFLFRVARALRRARFGIFTVGLAHLVALLVGLTMVHAHNGPALRYRDRLVGEAISRSPISRALRNGHPATAAALDFGANSLAGIAGSLAGYWAPAVYPLAIYRGWIGGIVSIDGRHHSRFSTRSEAAYYLITIILQLVPYTLAGGAGVNLGLARVRPTGDYAGSKLFGVPKEAIRDAGRIYLLVIPLFAVASTFEFLAVPG